MIPSGWTTLRAASVQHLRSLREVGENLWENIMALPCRLGTLTRTLTREWTRDTATNHVLHGRTAAGLAPANVVRWYRGGTLFSSCITSHDGTESRERPKGIDGKGMISTDGRNMKKKGNVRVVFLCSARVCIPSDRSSQRAGSVQCLQP